MTLIIAINVLLFKYPRMVLYHEREEQKTGGGEGWWKKKKRRIQMEIHINF